MSKSSHKYFFTYLITNWKVNDLTGSIPLITCEAEKISVDCEKVFCSCPVCECNGVRPPTLAPIYGTTSEPSQSPIIATSFSNVPTTMPSITSSNSVTVHPNQSTSDSPTMSTSPTYSVPSTKPSVLLATSVPSTEGTFIHNWHSNPTSQPSMVCKVVYFYHFYIYS